MNVAFIASLTWKKDTLNFNVVNVIPPFHQDALEALRSGSGLGSGQVWVPLVMFLNTPATDMSLLDTQTALTVARRGELTMSSLDTLDQVRMMFTG